MSIHAIPVGYAELVHCLYAGENCLALPKLNLQFLTFHDYLLRNFNLFRLEATYEIREDISDVIGRVAAFRQVSVLQTSWLPSSAVRSFLPLHALEPFLCCLQTYRLPFQTVLCLLQLCLSQLCVSLTPVCTGTFLLYTAICWPLTVRPSSLWLDHTCLYIIEAIRP